MFNENELVSNLTIKQLNNIIDERIRQRECESLQTQIKFKEHTLQIMEQHQSRLGHNRFCGA